MIEIPVDLPSDLVPFAWLIGVWEGTGVIDYRSSDHHYQDEFTHRVSFSHDGGDHLNYSATAWTTGPDGEHRSLVAETGFWRLARPATPADVGPALLPPTSTGEQRTTDDVEKLRTPNGGFEIEVAVAYSDGITELYLGEITGPRIDLSSDAIVRPASAKPYSSSSRMYGLVDEHLLWAWDVAALGGDLASHASARLAKVD